MLERYYNVKAVRPKNPFPSMNTSFSHPAACYDRAGYATDSLTPLPANPHNVSSTGVPSVMDVLSNLVTMSVIGLMYLFALGPPLLSELQHASPLATPDSSNTRTTTFKS